MRNSESFEEVSPAPTGRDTVYDTRIPPGEYQNFKFGTPGIPRRYAKESQRRKRSFVPVSWCCVACQL